jgi:hypothetical protein
MPEIIIRPPLQDATVKSLEPEKNFGATFYLGVGKAGDAVERALVQFPLAEIPAGAALKTAYLQLCLYENTFRAQPKEIALYRVIEPWEEYRVSFRKQPAYDPAPLSAVLLTGQAGGWISWEVSAVVRDWIAGTRPNWGLLVKMSDERQRGLARFYSRECSCSACWPRLVVSFAVGVCGAPLFTEGTETVTTEDADRGSTPCDLSTWRTVTVLVANGGPNPAVIQGEISADGVGWLPQGRSAILAAGQTYLFVPQIFLRFIRVRYRSAVPGCPTTLVVTWQAQR